MQATRTDTAAETLVDAVAPAAPSPTRRPRVARRRGRHVGWAALATLALVGGVVVVLALAPPATQVEAQSHFVVVDFFSGWCVACRQEAPQLARFVAEHDSPGGARLVGVIFEDTVANIRGFLGPELGRYPVVADPGGRIALDYGVDNPPEKYLVAPNGVIFEKIIGPVTAAGLDQQIAKAKAQGW